LLHGDLDDMNRVGLKVDAHGTGASTSLLPYRRRRARRAAHSIRSATIGSTVVARRAGTHAANAAVATSTSATAPSVIGSVGWIPNSIVEMNRAVAIARTTPMTTPASASRTLPPTTICR